MREKMRACSRSYQACAVYAATGRTGMVANSAFSSSQPQGSGCGKEVVEYGQHGQQHPRDADQVEQKGMFVPVDDLHDKGLARDEADKRPVEEEQAPNPVPAGRGGDEQYQQGGHGRPLGSPAAASVFRIVRCKHDNPPQFVDWDLTSERRLAMRTRRLPGRALRQQN